MTQLHLSLLAAFSIMITFIEKFFHENYLSEHVSDNLEWIANC